MAETRATINERLKRVSIKGKPYVEVAQRVTGFWEIFPNGSIKTDWLLLEPDQCVCQATVYDGDKILAQGTAWEVKKGNINTTSYVENCETSAIGRALGNAGIGSVESIASADEVAHAMAQQTAPKKTAPVPVPGPEWRQLYSNCLNAGIDSSEVKAAVSQVVGESPSADWSEEETQLVTDVLRMMLEEAEGGSYDE